MSPPPEAGPAAAPDSPMKLGQMVAKGATFLFLSYIGSNIVGLLGSIVLVRLLVSPAVYAPISIAITVPGLVMIGDATGVNTALTKYLSQFRAKGDGARMWSYFWAAFAIKAATGVALSVVAFALAGPMAAVIGKPEVVTYFQMASPLPFVWVTQVNVKSALLSLDSSRGYALLQVANEILLSFLPIVAVLMGLGALGALQAMVLANYLYLALAYGYCVLVVASQTKGTRMEVDFRRSFRPLIGFGAPLGFSNSFSSFAGQVANVVVARFASLGEFGLYSVASSASNFLSYVTDPVSSMLLPAYSRLGEDSDRSVVGLVSSQTTRYTTGIVLPPTVFFIAFASPFITLLFGDQYSAGGPYLVLLVAVGLTVGLARDPIRTFLTARGSTNLVAAITVLTSSLGILAALVFVPTLGLAWYLLAGLFIFVPGYLLMVAESKRSLGLGPPLRAVAPLYAAAAITGGLCVPVVLLGLPSAASVVIGLVGIPLAFVALGARLGGIGAEDFQRLRGMLAPQAVISKAADPLIRILETVAKRAA